MNSDLSKNPFSVQSPESINAEEVLSLFVEDFADFHQILRIGHTFLHGARGSGKSMIFRFLEPDCQVLKKKCCTNQLDFFAFYIPVRETELRLTELMRLIEEGHGSLALNEHLMAVNISIKVIAALKKIPVTNTQVNYGPPMAEFLTDRMMKLLENGGWKKTLPSNADLSTFESVRAAAASVLEDIYVEISQYVQRLSLGGNLTYAGALLGFHDFVRPFILSLCDLPFMPPRPVFLLIDDADNLSDEQTKILNTWVSSRGSADLSLKISTQRRYKSYHTVRITRSRVSELRPLTISLKSRSRTYTHLRRIDMSGEFRA